MLKSISTKFRQKRFKLFKSMLNQFKSDNITILDVGGTELYWENMNFTEEKLSITLLNLIAIPTKYDNIKSVIGDARCLNQYSDRSFDIVFSNSVIEHLYNLKDQKKMARELKRVGRLHYVQTPNYYFPLEPHFMFIGFQWLPLHLKMRVLNYYNCGYKHRVKNQERAIEIANSIRLLKEKEIKKLFPNSKITKERFLGLTKSFIVHNEL